MPISESMYRLSADAVRYYTTLNNYQNVQRESTIDEFGDVRDMLQRFRKRSESYQDKQLSIDDMFELFKHCNKTQRGKYIGQAICYGIGAFNYSTISSFVEKTDMDDMDRVFLTNEFAKCVRRFFKTEEDIMFRLSYIQEQAENSLRKASLNQDYLIRAFEEIGFKDFHVPELGNDLNWTLDCGKISQKRCDFKTHEGKEMECIGFLRAGSNSGGAQSGRHGGEIKGLMLSNPKTRFMFVNDGLEASKNFPIYQKMDVDSDRVIITCPSLIKYIDFNTLKFDLESAQRDFDYIKNNESKQLVLF